MGYIDSYTEYVITSCDKELLYKIKKEINLEIKKCPNCGELISDNLKYTDEHIHLVCRRYKSKWVVLNDSVIKETYRRILALEQ